MTGFRWYRFTWPIRRWICRRIGHRPTRVSPILIFCKRCDVNLDHAGKEFPA